MIYDLKSTTGADWRMTALNPSQDELKKWAAYCCGRYTASTDMVWLDDMNQSVSLEKLFPKPDGQLGSIPGIFVPALPTALEMADPIQALTSMARYKRQCDHVASIEKHIMTKSVNISQMLVQTISQSMLTLLRSTVRGMAIMDNLSEPLPIINLIMTTDFSMGSQLITDPVDKYYKARTYFESPAVKQKEGESSTVFAVRYNAEYQKVQLLATSSGCQAQLPSAQVLTYMFLSKMTTKYDPMKADYDKGTRVKPTTIDGVITHAVYYDTLPAAVSNAKYTPAEKLAYAIKLVARKTKGAKKSNNANNDVSPAWECRMHKTNAHMYADPACMKAREIYKAKKAAERASEKTA